MGAARDWMVLRAASFGLCVGLGLMACTEEGERSSALDASVRGWIDGGAGSVDITTRADSGKANDVTTTQSATPSLDAMAQSTTSTADETARDAAVPSASHATQSSSDAPRDASVTRDAAIPSGDPRVADAMVNTNDTSEPVSSDAASPHRSNDASVNEDASTEDALDAGSSNVDAPVPPNVLDALSEWLPTGCSLGFVDEFQSVEPACTGRVTCPDFNVDSNCIPAGERWECRITQYNPETGEHVQRDLHRLTDFSSVWEACLLTPLVTLRGGPTTAAISAPTCETTTDVDVDYCHKETGCSYELDSPLGLVHLWQPTRRDVDCFPLGIPGIATCVCHEMTHYNWGRESIAPGYSLKDVADDSRCDIVDELCESYVPPTVSRDECIGDWRTEPCTNSTDCERITELPGGGSLAVGHMIHAQCPGVGGQPCQCARESNAVLGTIGEGASVSEECSVSFDYCAALFDLPLLGPPRCETAEVVYEMGECVSYLDCTADTEFEGYAGTRTDHEKLQCRTGSDGLWDCECPASLGVPSSTFSVDPAGDRDAACKDAAETCTEWIESALPY